MGSLLSRSSSVRPEGSKSRWRKGKGKGKRFQRMEPTNEGDNIQNDNEHNNSNGTLINSHEEWKKRIEQQQQQQQQHLANMNGDPPGAPSTYPSSYPMTQNDLMTQSWTSHHEANNQYYPGNLHSMTTPQNISYDLNQYGQTQIPNTFINQSQQVMLEDRPSKKVQFARPIEQQSSFKNPLTASQSWHELSPTNADVSTSTTRPEPIITRQSVHRPIVPKNAVSLAPLPIEKPIYVGIDHRATLAERGQTTAHKHHHKNNPDNTNNHRTRSHTHHQQHKHQESSDSSNGRNTLPSTRSFDPAQMTRPLTTTSTSTIIPSRSVPHTDQPIYNDSEMKISKNRSNRQHTERQIVVNNDIKTSRGRSSHSQPREQQQQQQLQQRTTINRNNSPLRTEIVRRSENKQQGTPVLRIPISQSQQRQKQSTMSSTTITTTSLTRTRV